MAEKFDWKTTLLTFLVGIFVGRRLEGALKDETHYPQSRPPVVPRFSDPFCQELADLSEDEFLECLFLVMTVMKEVNRELVGGLDTDALAEQAEAFSRNLRETGTFRGISHENRSAVMKLFSSPARFIASPTPMVPAYVPPHILRIAGEFMRISELHAEFCGCRRHKESDFLHDTEFVAELETVLDKWERELRPETYTEPLRGWVFSLKTLQRSAPSLLPPRRI